MVGWLGSRGGFLQGAAAGARRGRSLCGVRLNAKPPPGCVPTATRGWVSGDHPRRVHAEHALPVARRFGVHQPGVRRVQAQRRGRLLLLLRYWGRRGRESEGQGQGPARKYGCSGRQITHAQNRRARQRGRKCDQSDLGKHGKKGSGRSRLARQSSEFSRPGNPSRPLAAGNPTIACEGAFFTENARTFLLFYVVRVGTPVKSRATPCHRK